MAGSDLPARFGPPSLGISRVDRQVGRQLERVRGRAAVEAEEQLSRVRLIEAVAEEATLATGHLAQVEALLVQAAPHAQARISGIADAAAIGMANLVVRAGRER